MENPARTAEHLARIDVRRQALQVWCAEHLPVRSRFVLEIGCGHGHFLTAYATAHPDELCVGITLNLSASSAPSESNNGPAFRIFILCAPRPVFSLTSFQAKCGQAPSISFFPTRGPNAATTRTGS